MIVKWTETATLQVYEIAEYIATDSPNNAVKWVDDIHAKVETFIDQPYQYPEPEEAFNTHIRECTYGRFRIIYKIDLDIIYVMNVKRGAQEKKEDEYHD